MTVVPYVENPAYRSAVHLLNLYCLFKMGLFLWNTMPFFTHIIETAEFTPVQVIIRHPLLFLTPVMVIGLLCLSLSRTREAHVVRLILLGFWLFMRLIFLRSLFRNPNLGYTALLLNVLDFLCVGLFLYLLAKRNAPRSGDA